MSGSRVVVGVDGSPLSATAVQHAARAAHDRGLPLHVVHAFAPDLPMLGFGALADREVVTAHGRRLLAAAVARAHAVHPDLEVTTALPDGYASTALVSASRSAALVVVGATGFGLLSHTTMGAVARQVLAHARCFVLVVGHETAGAPTRGGRVVVGVDGSKASLTALRAAAHEAQRLGGSLEVVHVWQASGAHDPTLASASSWEDYEQGIERSVRATLAEPGLPAVPAAVHVVREDPVRALVEHAEGADLLVVGSRGAGGFEGLRLGSTATSLVGRCPAPLLVTR
ncbi:universal stress protein [Phycicoccus duodecadis]|jgi:nucleotide-binding universal stress UspA family protein|uniref:Nucleotide-binding universal stress UspA family protein n=1 Tax=Phycicoccus duodecadis TaxID=173053 RepID=A0A2N3YFP4_9MICO|nr:universal stress protein [Phycicoccus duodecadis]PKW25656.1 nucleotide-binding universal stress UspA family protein [Phycicoccus duodecadis]